MHHLRGWVFDLDGTLTIAQHDFPAIRRELGIAAGEDILTHIAELPEEEGRKMRARLDAIERRLADDVQPALGAAELIRHLHREGRHIGILTRNLRSVAMSSLDILGVLDCFDPAHILGREEALPKPHPDGVLKLLDAWGVAREEAIMVGDFRFDLETGRAAGCHTCLIHAENGWPELTDWHVNDCSALLHRLRLR